MATAEPPAARSDATAGANATAGADAGSRRWVWAGLALVLGGGLALRVWGTRQGLPYAYNADEYDHFVVHAMKMFERGTLNPEYFANPPAFTYVLHFLFAVSYGGAHGAVHAFAVHPEAVYTLARVAAALLGTLALWLLYLAGARLFDRAVGLLAAAIEAVAFLPVFYAHLALNDVPTLAPATLSLLGSAGVVRKGRVRDYVLAGVGLGLACASKYTAGIVLVPLLAAAALRAGGGTEAGEADAASDPGAADQSGAGAARRARRALVGLALASAAALGAFVIANPYALLDYSAFHAELAHQSSLSSESQGKLGAPKDGGLAYYLWSFTWGLGWAPALAAVGGAIAVWRHERRVGWVLVPAAVAFLGFMGTESRYFGRWLMPIFPIACLLAAFFVVALARRAGRALAGRSAHPGPLAHPGTPAHKPSPLPAWRAFAAALPAVALVAAVLAQGLIYSVHSGMVLARADTRNLTRAWMLGHIPAGAKIVAEPVEPEEWAQEVRRGTSTARNGYRWRLYPSLFLRVRPDGKLAPRYIRQVGLEDYERTLYPVLIGFYEREGFCWVITGSTESGRAYADPRVVPQAIAYYRALEREGELVYRASPYASGQGPVAFNFDWSFDYYPLAYSRPGPLMSVYHLHGGGCG